jgi:tetratricopeptide (TPR) repeat protein
MQRHTATVHSVGMSLSALEQSAPPVPRRRGLRRELVILLLITIAGGTAYGGLLWWVDASKSRLVAIGERRLEEGQPAEARNALAWLLWVEPDHPQALLIVGRSHFAERNFSEAVECFARVPAEAPQRVEADLRQVRALLDDARFEQAEEILIRRRDHPSAYEELRWLYFNQLRRRDVERLLEERLARHPDDPQVLIDFLYTEFRQQVAEEGLAMLQKIHEHQSGQASIVLALGYCHWRLGEVETATKHLEEALRMRPNHLDTRLIVGEFLMERGELDAAGELLDEEPSDDDRWWWLRSRLASRRGEVKNAIEMSEQALKRRPHELPYVHGYAQLLQQSGRREDASQVIQRARELETCKSRLELIVLSGDLERLTPDLCREIAFLCDCRGQRTQAAAWRRLAAGTASRPTGRHTGMLDSN